MLITPNVIRVYRCIVFIIDHHCLLLIRFIRSIRRYNTSWQNIVS